MPCSFDHWILLFDKFLVKNFLTYLQYLLCVHSIESVLSEHQHNIPSNFAQSWWICHCQTKPKFYCVWSSFSMNFGHSPCLRKKKYLPCNFFCWNCLVEINWFYSLSSRWVDDIFTKVWTNESFFPVFWISWSSLANTIW